MQPKDAFCWFFQSVSSVLHTTQKPSPRKRLSWSSPAQLALFQHITVGPSNHFPQLINETPRYLDLQPWTSTSPFSGWQLWPQTCRCSFPSWCKLEVVAWWSHADHIICRKQTWSLGCSLIFSCAWNFVHRRYEPSMSNLLVAMWSPVFLHGPNGT